MRNPFFGLAALALFAGPVHAASTMPPVVDVTVPGDTVVVHVAIPPDMCTYPAEVRERLARFLEGDLHLLEVAGDCVGVDRLLREGRSVVSTSMQLAIFKSEVALTTRSKPVAYRRACFEQFPPKGNAVPDAVRQALKDEDTALTLGQTASLGLLAATRDAVFGGNLAELSREPARVFQVQVIACFSPANVPLLWLFQATVDRDANLETITARLRTVLALAEGQVAQTIEINRKGR